MNNIKLKNLIAKLQKLILSLSNILENLRNNTKQDDNNFEVFALAIGQRESSGNYKAINPYGYVGKYQFGMARLCDLGITNRKVGTTNYRNESFEWMQGYSKEYFLNNPDFQDRVFKKHIIDLIKRIKSKFPEYIGKEINEEKTSLSGFVAGAHLGGIGGLGSFLKDFSDNFDANGTKISDYIKEFNNYNLDNL